MATRPRSCSYVQFLERLTEIEELQQAAGFQGLPRNPKRIMALNRSSVVMLCSHLEGYIEDVITEAVDFLDSQGIDSSRLPPSLKMAHSLPAVKRVVEIEKPDKRCSELTSLFTNHMHLWTMCPSLPKGVLKPEAVVGDFSNPRPDRIISVFRTLGIHDIFSRLTSAGLKRSTVYAVIITTTRELVEKRNSIAHGDRAVFVTSSDVHRYIECTRKLCRALDFVLGKHLLTLSGTDPWRQHAPAS